MKQLSRLRSERSYSWAEICCFGCTCLQLFWPRVVLRKWLNITNYDSDFSADSSGDEEDDDNAAFVDATATEEVTPRLRRRNSETFRAQYIDKKEIRICVGTWNVGGKVPHDYLDIDQWLDSREPADIYVLGLQEIVPLNAGNIFGPEDCRPVSVWENVIRESINRVPPPKKYKSFSEPPSPSKFKVSEDAPDIEDEIFLETDSDEEEEIHPLEDYPDGFYDVRDKTIAEDDPFMDSGVPKENHIANQEAISDWDLQKQVSFPRRLDRLKCFRSALREDDDDDDDDEDHKSATTPSAKLCKVLSGTERLGLSWPEPPMNLVGQHVYRNTSFGVRSTKCLTTAKSFKAANSFEAPKSFKAAKSFKTYNSFKIKVNNDRRGSSDISLVTDLDLESLIYRRRRPEYVRIASKQMVGILLTIWVRRGLRKEIHNLKVSTVGVGVMGYIGNKGAVSVSMSIYQTSFCFVCTHLTSGEKEGDGLKRNADVYEILRRTNFHPADGLAFPRQILDHERIIWLGDLNYRINLPYDETRELISEQQWSKLLDKDQLTQELKFGRAFDGWSEGTLNFPPTYKYEFNSERYCGEDPKAGRRNPAWCDRILSHGNGLKLLQYRRAEISFSDHRPVTAIYSAEVEAFSARKLQRALTFTDAEIENEEMVIDQGTTLALSHSRFDEEIPEWGR